METFQTLQETKLSSQPIFDGNVLHIYKDTVRLPNGKEAAREYTVHHGAVCILPLLENGDVLLERQFRYPIGAVVTEIPAGKLDYIGEDPHEAALRELREETGAIAESWTPLGSLIASPGCYDEVLYLYLAQDLHYGATDPDEDEFLRLERIPFQEMVHRIMNGEIEDAKTVAAVLKAKVLLDL